MYISNLKIENYRNFEKFDIELHPFTLIIGENNTGKSNLLEALGLIFSQEITVFKKRTLEYDDFNYSTIKKFKSNVADQNLPLTNIVFPEIKIEVIMKDFNSDQKAIVADWFIDENFEEAKLIYIFRIREGWRKRQEWLSEQRKIAAGEYQKVDFPVKQYEYLIFGGNDPVNKVDYYFLKMLKMEFLDALRDAKRELIASGDYRLLYRVLNNRDESKFADIRTYLQGLKSLLDKHQELVKIKEDIKTYLDRISLQESELENIVNFNFTSPEASEMLKKISMEYGDDPISVERNGLGRNNLLYISLILSHLSDQRSGASQVYFRVVGIEEPEAHLHPHLQEHLSKNIEGEVREDLQLILTSHSPYISTKLNFGVTYILYKDQNGTVKNHNMLFGLKEDSDTVRYLKKFLDATNSKMFFAKKVILVEGISEQLLIPIFFQLHQKKTLEQCGYNIVNVNGVSFRHFLEIIKNGYFIKCLVLTDKDTDDMKDSNSRANKLKSDFNNTEVIRVEITDLKTFEKDIISANKKGKGKKILYDTLIKTKPINGKAFKEKNGSKNIDEDSYFQEIEKYKSEFAFNLQEILKQDATGFEIPQYIINGFVFLNGNDGK